DRAAVGLAQGVEQLADGAAGEADEGAVVEGAVEVALLEAELGEFEQRVAGAGFAEGVEAGDEVAEVAVGEGEADDAGLEAGVGAGGRGRTGRGGGPAQAQLEALEEQPPC